MSLIMELIGPELSALELENLPYLTLFTLGHLQILSLIMELVGPELSALELENLPYLTLFTL